MGDDRGDVSHEHKRSPHWSHVRDQFLKGKGCAICGATEMLEAHHIVPFHICLALDRGYAELDPRNLIALCRGPRDCHLLLGHLDDFKSFNLQVAGYSPRYAALTTQEAVKADQPWQLAHLHRPRPWDYQTTDSEKAAVLAYIDQHYPIAQEVTA